MKKTQWFASAFGVSTIALLAIGLASPVGAAQKTEHVRGTINAVSGSGFSVDTGNGTRKIRVSSKTTITGVTKSSLSKVKPGTFIGTANVPSNDASRALEVVVFPDSMKGTGLGDYPWDLPAGSSKSNGSGNSQAMTNGTVKSSGSSAMTNGTGQSSGSQAMTNGTVKSASGSSQKTVTVDYGKGKKTIKIPSDVPVVMLQKGSRKDIVKGAHVFVAGSKGGEPLKAKLVAVGLNGTVPPM